MASRPGLDERDAILALTTISFDIAVTELWLPLAVGARIELVDRETAADAERLAAVIESAGVTVMQATPATWTLLLEGGWPGRPGLKVLAGGEALSASLAERLLGRVGALWNVYGPTETTVWSTLHPVAAGERRISIGLPLANTTVHLIDLGGEPAPVGVPGELCIGGEGLARGYLGRPDLTAERFVPDLFGGERAGGGRLYRTGDLARRLPGGELEFLGRIDHQVKVRGFRIELGEIEATLSRLPGVARSAVLAREGGGGESRLVAFLVVEPGAEPSVGELRVGLQQRLPEYMVPALFVTLEALPLTSSGKVDRRALAQLPVETAQDLAKEREYQAPRSEIEAFLARLWAAVLGRERVGVEDNFFELGGDSIQGIQMVTRARKAGVRFTPRHLFQHQTIAALATVVVVDAAESGERPQPALTPFQRRLLAADSALLRRWNEAALIALPAGFDDPALEAALGELARRHAALRSRFRRDAEGWHLESFAPEERIAIERIDLTATPDEGLLLALAGEIRDQIDLAVRPWTAARFHLGGGAPDRLLLAVHRLTVDGPSWEPLLDDLRTIGRRLGAERTVEAARLAAGGSEPGGAGLVRELREDESRELLADAAQSPEEILATALVEAVADWSGARRVALEVEVRRLSGEESPEGAVGCFSAIVPLRVEVEKESGAVLKRIKEELRRAPEPGGSVFEPELALRWRGRLSSDGAGWPAHPLRSRLSHPGRRTFEVLAALVDGRLRVEWSYQEGAHRPEAAQALADATMSALRTMTAARRTAEAEAFTPFDFPAAGLNQGDLDDLLAELAMD
jgi:aryl carrier-like protein